MKLNAHFWNQFARSACFPDNCNCEVISEGFILQPFSVITSLPIIAVGIYMLYHSWKSRRSLVLGTLVTLTGIGSVLVHATFTKFGTYLDFSGIYLIFLWIFCKSLEDKIKYPFIVFLGLSFSCLLLLFQHEELRFYIGTVCGFLGIFGLLYSLNFSFQDKINSSIKFALAVFIFSVMRL